MNKHQKQFQYIDQPSLIAYLDLSNMFHWQDVLKWNFNIFQVIKQLLSHKNVKEVRVYYGINEREKEKSIRFHQRLRESGSILVTKPVKWIKKEITKTLFVKNITLGKLDGNAHAQLEQFMQYLISQNITVEEPKCNFDVEISLDMLDSVDKVSGILLFSGDSDFHEPLQRLTIKNKKVYIVSVRGHVAKELWKVCSQYIDFGQWYKGPKKRKPFACGEGPRV